MWVGKVIDHSAPWRINDKLWNHYWNIFGMFFWFFFFFFPTRSIIRVQVFRKYASAQKENSRSRFQILTGAKFLGNHPSERPFSWSESSHLAKANQASRSVGFKAWRFIFLVSFIQLNVICKSKLRLYRRIVLNWQWCISSLILFSSY